MSERIVGGKPGDKYIISDGYAGKWGNSVGTPVDPDSSSSSKKKEVPTPLPTGAGKVTTVIRPDFRKVPKDSPVFPKNKK
jgi:hypothetical protein